MPFQSFLYLTSGLYIGGFLAAFIFPRRSNTMNRTYYRGDMYFTDFGIGLGSEQMGYRPAVIIQNNTGNMYSSTVIVAAITSQKPQKALLPTHYPMGAESGLEAPSIILLEQIRTVSKERLDKYLGRLSIKHLQGLNHALEISVGLITPGQENLVMCLCKSCADNFRAANKYDLQRAGKRSIKEICTYCNHRMGYDYELIPKE